MGSVTKKIHRKPTLFILLQRYRRSLTYAVLTSIILFLGYLHSNGQSGASLYHLQGETFQGSNFNPAFMPQEKFILGLPVVSGITIGANAPFTYDDVTIENADGQPVFQEDKAVGLLGEKSFVSSETDITLLYLGWRPREDWGIWFMARQRAYSTGFLDKDLAELAILGNSGFINRTIDVQNTLIDARYYREYGLGITASILDYGIDFGARVKVINGIASVITEKDLSAFIQISDNVEVQNLENLLDQSASLSNVALRTSGLDESENLRYHTSPNKNFGMGIDLGVNWQVNDFFSTALAVNDLGFITWKNDVKNYVASDIDVDVQDFVDVIGSGTISSSLIDSVQNVLEGDTTTTQYTTGLNTNIFASGSFHMTPKDQATLTVASFFVQDQVRMMYSLGYTRKFGNFLALSGNVTRVPQSGIDVGVGMAIDFAGMQIYAASDKMTKIWNYKDTQAFDARFGIVFIFGRGKPKVDKGPKPDSYDYNDGAIYQKIKRRKQPQPYKYPKRYKVG